MCIPHTGAIEESPEFQSARVMRGEGEDEWVVRVEWSEVTVSCSGSVSQYVLCVTPLTPGGQSGECMTTDQTQFDLTVTSNMRYNLTIRADACDNSIMGNEIDPGTLRLNGKVHPNVCYCVKLLQMVQGLPHTLLHTVTLVEYWRVSLYPMENSLSRYILCTVYDSPYTFTHLHQLV